MQQRNPRTDDSRVNGSIVVWLAGLVFGLGAGMVLVYHLVLSGRSDLTPVAPVQPTAMTVSATVGPDPALLAVQNAAVDGDKQAN
ncbi:MAG: hypothetical protein INF91_07415 [Alphaproteobacteria bacterium]|nr:hypothetical protein [Alphaproteobacteria bacterium]